MIVVDFVASECDISVAPGEMPGIIGPVVSPEIVYSPTSVTITLHASDGPGAISCNGVRHETEIALGVRLREPLSGRTLLDGSTSPPELRSYR